MVSLCGIGGLITDYPFDEEEAEICRNLLVSLVRRGEDAWGFFDGRYVYKEPGSFVESKYYDKLPDMLIGKRIFLCHTRLATRGTPKKNRNNHPFVLRPFVFAHNGTLFYTDAFKNEWRIETDSFWLLYWIWKEYQTSLNPAEAIKRGVRHVRGGYACWLYNFDDGATYLFRNHYNPAMTVYYEREQEKGRGVLFGSDARSLFDALGVTKIRIKALESGLIYKIVKGEISVMDWFKYPPMRWWEMRRYDLIHSRYKKYIEETLEVVRDEG